MVGKKCVIVKQCFLAKHISYSDDGGMG